MTLDDIRKRLNPDGTLANRRVINVPHCKCGNVLLITDRGNTCKQCRLERG